MGKPAGGDVVKRIGAFISFRYLSKMDIARYQDYAFGFCVSNKFEEAGALGKLEGFASKYGADFYGLPRNTTSITLLRQPWQLPAAIPFDDSQLIPLGAGTTLNWKMDH